MITAFRSTLRNKMWWQKIQELRREGIVSAWKRSRIQNKILNTKPIITEQIGTRSVHILTWRRDWINALWALKSFYFFSGKNYPLHIHDGGLEEHQRRKILRHFPNARIWEKSEADKIVQNDLRRSGFLRCLEYRKVNIASLKLFDFFMLGNEEEIISIDSDIVFFQKPMELISTYTKNLFNEDMQYAYSLSENSLENKFGIRPPPKINSGLSLIRKNSLNFNLVENWLKDEELFANRWVTEQTIHALSATISGVELLPNTYMVSTNKGIVDGAVCKHYPGFFRPLLYAEGMFNLLNSTNFMEEMRPR